MPSPRTTSRQVDAVVWYRAVDPGKSVIEVQKVHEVANVRWLLTCCATPGRHSPDDLLKEKDKL